MQVSLPHKVHHRARMLPKQPKIPITDVLQGLILQYKAMFIVWLAYVTDWAKLDILFYKSCPVHVFFCFLSDLFESDIRSKRN